MEKNNKSQTGATGPSINPDSPKMRMTRLIVGIVIITLGIVIFNLSSKWYKEAEARDAAKKEQIEKVKNDTTLIPRGIVVE